MQIAITGATGFVGSLLVQMLAKANHRVVIFTRNPDRARRIFPPAAFPHLDIVAYRPTEPGEWQQAIAGCDGVVNLAGEPIADHRWTPREKQIIQESRVVGTQQLVGAIQQAEPKPQVLVNASAVGYYGSSETAVFDETSPPGDDFLAQVCQGWEAAARAVEPLGTRLVILRFGIVLGQEGGALAKMLTPFKLFAGGPLGTGRQWLSWIHRMDLVNLILQSLQDTNFTGALNATAPQPVRMEEFCATLGEALHRPSWLPVPGFALEVLLGEGAKVVLEGQQVLPQRTQTLGFVYQYPALKPALASILAARALRD